jgi:RNA recognition motif-containing protein
MAKNIFVGNLTEEVTEADLRDNFKQFGEVVSAAVIKDKFTGQSKGFGFVEMASEKAGQEAIEKFNGGELGGKKITVSEARPRPERGGAGRSAGFGKRNRY